MAAIRARGADRLRLFGRTAGNVGVDEDLQQVAVDLAPLRLVGEDVVRLLLRDGALVGTIRRGERVVDVGDRHHARRQRNLRLLQAARVAAAGELLVMAVGDVRHALERSRPGDLLQEAEGVRDVRFDLAPFLGGERPLAYGELDYLVLAQERPRLAREGALVGELGDVLEPTEDAGRKDRRPVAGEHELEHAGQLAPARLELAVDLGHESLGAPRFVQEHLHLAAFGAQLFLREQRLESSAQDLQLVRLQLVRLDEHVLADADLAEIVQQRRVAQLLALVAGELRPAPAARRPVRARQRVGEADREPGHAARVTRRGRVARFDRDHAGADESLEELLDLLVEQSIVDGRRGLPAQSGEQLTVFLAERSVAALVERLQDADDLAFQRAHRNAKDALRAVSRFLVHVPIEARIGVGVGNVDGLVRLSDGAGDPLAHREADLARAHALRDLAPQLGSRAVEQEQRAAVGLHYA